MCVCVRAHVCVFSCMLVRAYVGPTAYACAFVRSRVLPFPYISHKESIFEKVRNPGPNYCPYIHNVPRPPIDVHPLAGWCALG